MMSSKVVAAIAVTLVILSGVVKAQEAVACTNQPGSCENSGMCVEKGGETCCFCAPGYGGTNCAEERPGEVGCQSCPSAENTGCFTPPAPPAAQADDTTCFSMDSTVETPSGPKSLSNLQPGDEVLTVSELGAVTFEPVITDVHHLPGVKTWFYNIITDTTHIKVTGKHYIHVGYTPESSKLVVSDDITPGDPLLVYGDGGHISVERVRRVEVVEGQGVSNPVVASGRLVVNHVLASVYSSDIPPLTPTTAHSLMWVVRVMSRYHINVRGGEVGGMPAWAFYGNMLRAKLA